MAFCKRCVCGHVNIYEQKGRAPLRCSHCSRFIAAVTEEIYEEQKKAAELPVPDPKPDTGREEKQDRQEAAGPDPKLRLTPKYFRITLETPDGSLVIPVTEPMTVGRNAVGKEYLGAFADVSREHFTIEPRLNGISATLTDKSSMGTYVNGTRMISGGSLAVSNSTMLRLGNNAVLIVRVKEV